MTTLSVLAAAIQSVHPAAYKHFDGQVPSATTLPWITTRVTIPGVSERSLAATSLTLTGRLIVTVAATTQNGVRILAEAAIESWEYARIAPEGWAPFRLLLEGASEPYEDTDTVLANGQRPVVARMTFSFTTSRTT